MSNIQHIYDWNEYPRDVINKIKIMTSYFVDILYNHLYIEAVRDKKRGTVKSVTDGYKQALAAFMYSFSQKKNYSRYIQGIHEYFNSNNFGTISFNERMTALANVFVPDDYCKQMDNTKKYAVLINVIKSAINKMVIDVLKNDMSRIIDNHRESTNIDIMQEKMVNYFLEERELIYIRFVENRHQPVNKNDEIDKVMVSKIRKALQDTVKENVELTQQISLVKQELSEYRGKMEKVNDISEYTHRIEKERDGLADKLKQANIKLLEANEKIDELNKKIGELNKKITSIEDSKYHQLNKYDNRPQSRQSVMVSEPPLCTIPSDNYMDTLDDRGELAADVSDNKQQSYELQYQRGENDTNKRYDSKRAYRKPPRENISMPEESPVEDRKTMPMVDIETEDTIDHTPKTVGDNNKKTTGDRHSSKRRSKFEPMGSDEDDDVFDISNFVS